MKKRYAIDWYVKGCNGLIDRRFYVYDRNKMVKDNCEVVVCVCYTRAAARKIAKALNEMDVK